MRRLHTHTHLYSCCCSACTCNGGEWMCNYIWSCWKQSYRQGLYSWSKWLPLRFTLLWSAAFWKLFYHINPPFLFYQLWKAFPRSPTGVDFESWTRWVTAPRAGISVPQLITLAGCDKLRARAGAREPKFRRAQVLQIREFVRKWSKTGAARFSWE